jgi:hypothetical protein
MGVRSVPGIAGALTFRSTPTRTSGASSAVRSTWMCCARVESTLQHSFSRACPIRYASYADCTCAGGRARRSWSGAHTARSLTSSWTCSPSHRPTGTTELGELRTARRRAGDPLRAAGSGHGFQALIDTADLSYMIDRAHDPAEDLSIAFDDLGLATTWPHPVTIMWSRDRLAPPGPTRRACWQMRVSRRGSGWVPRLRPD